MCFSPRIVSSTLVLAAVVVSGAMAQPTRTYEDEWRTRQDRAGTDRPVQTWGSRNVYRPEFERLTDLIDKDVVDVRGERVGTIDDLAIDGDHGIVAYAVIDRRQSRDEGERRVGVPFTVLRPQLNRDELLLETDGRLLARLGAVDENDYARLHSHNWANGVHRIFAVQPYWVSPGRAGRITVPQDRDIIEEDIYGYGDPYLEEEPEHGQRSPTLWEREMRGKSDRGRMMRGTPIRPRMNPRMQARMPDQPGRIVLADQLLDEGVYDRADDRLGRLRDLMVDLDMGAVAYAVVSADGRYGGDTRYAVPWMVVRLTGSSDDPQLSLNIPEYELTNAPAFDDDDWPNLASPQWTRDLHAYYGVQPTWTHYGYLDTQQDQKRPESRRQQGGWQTDQSRHGDW